MALQKPHSKSEFLALGLTEHLRGRGEASSSLEAAPGQGADTNRGRSFLHVKLGNPMDIIRGFKPWRAIPPQTQRQLSIHDPDR